MLNLYFRSNSIVAYLAANPPPVNKYFTQLWDWVREFVPLPDDLPYGEPTPDSGGLTMA